MEEIDISQLLGYFKTKIIYIIFAMSVFFCLSSIYVNQFRVPVYTSSTTILLNQSSDTSTISSSDISLNNSLVTTYSEIIKSKRVLRQVIELLDLDMGYEELAGQVSVGEVNDTSIIRISVTNKDAKLAADITNSIATVFSEEIVKIYNIENVSIIDKAEAATKASSSSAIKIILVATILGGILSVVVIFIVFYFDTTIKNEEEIEKQTGIPVIGIIPVSREKIKASAHRKYYEDKAHHKNVENKEVAPIQKEVIPVQSEERKSTEDLLKTPDEMMDLPKKHEEEQKND